MTKLVLMYTSGRKPFALRFMRAHQLQALQLGMDFRCVTAESMCDFDAAQVIQRPLQSQVKFCGIFEAILQGMEGVPDDTVVYLAEDDVLYQRERFAYHFAERALRDHDCSFYHWTTSWICPTGFYANKGYGACLHAMFGTAESIRRNIHLKNEEYNSRRLKPDGTPWPGTSVEPVRYPNRRNPDVANECYMTDNVMTVDPLSLDFRGYGTGQTWKPKEDVLTWQDDGVWGNSGELWGRMIEGRG